MNSRQAKLLHLPQLMAHLGYEPVSIKKGGNEYWYNSPFRAEKEPSFHTSYLSGKWIWNDFGDSGGTVIDFIMRHESLGSVRDALNFLEATYPTNLTKPTSQGKNDPLSSKSQATLFSFQQQPVPAEQENFISQSRELLFLKATQLQNPVIFRYLQKRAIPESLSKRYLREIFYRNIKTDKQFFAFGMKNQSGGYEIRAATDDYKFKSALIKRDITHIKGQHESSNTVSIFEGMLDFLSLLAMLNVSNLSGDSLIMHSLSSFQPCVTAIETMNYQKINLFLDNNKAGREHTERFQTQFGERITSQSSLFEPYEDINDALIANAIPDFYK